MKNSKEHRFHAGPFRFELSWLTGSMRLGLSLASHEKAVTVAFCIALFSLYVSIDNWRLQQSLERLTKRSDQQYGNGREICIYWFEDGLWWSLWSDPMESRSRDPWYAKMHVFRPVDFLLGRPMYSTETIKTERTIVPMPEGGYPATVTINRDSWKRSRWFKARVLTRCEVKPDTPIPFPGKGENSWDCGEDASHSLYGVFPDALSATMGMAQSVMRDRLRYGSGWSYVPEGLRR